MPTSALRRAAAAALFPAVCALALSACAKPGTGNQSNPPPTAGPGTSVFGSVGATTNPPAPPAPPTYPNSAEAYAKAAVAAWAAKDTTRLNQLEVGGGSLHTMLACGNCYEVHFALHGTCDGAAGSSYCLFFNKVGDLLRLRLDNTLIGKPRAVGLGSIFEPISFPSDDKAYAQEALDAWRDGNDARLKLLTSANMTSAQVTALGANPASGWTYDHSEGAMGSTYLSWNDGAGHLLTFRFANTGPAPTSGPTSQHRITEILY